MNVLLTCFGGKNAFALREDFKNRDINMVTADMNGRADITSLPPDHPDFSDDLVKKAKDKDIDMIIFGVEDEAFNYKGEILANTQDYSPRFLYKSELYKYLKGKDFPIPEHWVADTPDEFPKGAGPFLAKPDRGHGGKSMYIISDKFFPSDIPVINRDSFCTLLSEPHPEPYIVMHYYKGISYDVDVLTYKNGKQYYGVRQRFNNLQYHMGNKFDRNEKILRIAHEIYEKIPTKYVVDYDFFLPDGGEPVLLEINLRPSINVVTYLPYGINFYYILAKSYLQNEHIEIPKLDKVESYVQNIYCR